MILFIASEVMFFVAWFWAYFNTALFPADVHQIVRDRAPRRPVAAEGHRDLRSVASAAAQHADPAHLGHHGDLGAPRAPGERPQGPEMGSDLHHPARADLHLRAGATNTCHAAFNYSGNIYGATFFMATGFHGAHVIIGTIFLIVCLIRAYRGPFHADAASRLRIRRLVLALRRRGVAVPVRLIYVWGAGARRGARRRSLRAGFMHGRAAAGAAPFRLRGRSRLRQHAGLSDMPMTIALARSFARARLPLPALRQGQAVRGFLTLRPVRGLRSRLFASPIPPTARRSS